MVENSICGKESRLKQQLMINMNC